MESDNNAQDARLSMLESVTANLGADGARISALESTTASLGVTNTAEDARLTALEGTDVTQSARLTALEVPPLGLVLSGAAIDSLAANGATSLDGTTVSWWRAAAGGTYTPCITNTSRMAPVCVGSLSNTGHVTTLGQHFVHCTADGTKCAWCIAGRSPFVWMAIVDMTSGNILAQSSNTDLLLGMDTRNAPVAELYGVGDVGALIVWDSILAVLVHMNALRFSDNTISPARVAIGTGVAVMPMRRFSVFATPRHTSQVMASVDLGSGPVLTACLSIVICTDTFASLQSYFAILPTYTGEPASRLLLPLSDAFDTTRSTVPIVVRNYFIGATDMAGGCAGGSPYLVRANTMTDMATAAPLSTDPRASRYGIRTPWASGTSTVYVRSSSSTLDEFVEASTGTVLLSLPSTRQACIVGYAAGVVWYIEAPDETTRTFNALHVATRTAFHAGTVAGAPAMGDDMRYGIQVAVDVNGCARWFTRPAFSRTICVAIGGQTALSPDMLPDAAAEAAGAISLPSTTTSIACTSPRRIAILSVGDNNKLYLTQGKCNHRITCSLTAGTTTYVYVCAL